MHIKTIINTYGEVGSELGSDDAVGAVVASDLAPHDAELVALGLVDVGDLLAVVEVATFLVLNTIDLDQAGLVVCVATSSVIRNIKQFIFKLEEFKIEYKFAHLWYPRIVPFTYNLAGCTEQTIERLIRLAK